MISSSVAPRSRRPSLWGRDAIAPQQGPQYATEDLGHLGNCITMLSMI